MKEFQNKTALVTGGLSGIGKATVFELASKGCTVVIFDVQDDKAAAVIEEAERLGGVIEYRNCNLFNSTEIDKGFDFIEEKYEHLDFAFNNAGFGILDKKFGEVTEDEIDQLLGINVKACMLCMIRELKIMEKNGFGRIVSTSSGAGLTGSKGMALYSASKHAVVGLTKSAALDYPRQGITVNAIAPGAIETELVLSLKERDPAEFEKGLNRMPIGRFGQPEEIARVVSFLFQEESAFINGTVIPVDSGFVAGS